MHPALILAGGASSRMGRNKATVLVDGVAMIVRVAHALRDAGCRPIYIAVRDMFQRQEVLAVLGHLTDVECVLDTVLESRNVLLYNWTLKIDKSVDLW